MNAPGLDVIVPCYNYGRYLRQCVTSVLREPRLAVRVLIIDDASSDDSAEEARRLAAEDDRIEVRVHATNQGHVATFNEGLDWVEQDYLLLLSADDIAAPGALRRAVDLMEARPEVAFVIGRAIRFRTEDEFAAAEREALDDLAAGVGEQVTAGWDFIGRLCHSSMNPVETATAVVRSAVHKRVGHYAPALRHSGDLEMWLRCARHGHVGEIAAVQAFVRLHGANMRDGYCGQDAQGDYLQRRDAFVSFFERLGDDPDHGVLLDVALSALAQNLLWDASRAIEQGRPCAELVALAIDIHPGVRRTAQYRRLMIKRRMHKILDIARRPQRRHALA
jgi:glycosyltransferase involved in cell wall biosynthesis